MNATLVCFSCGKKHDIEISSPITFAFELVKIANDLGLYGALDMKYNRALVFCDSDCAERQKTKKGTFRLRPIKGV